jgi:chlorophyllide a reductase subunit Y
MSDPPIRLQRRRATALLLAAMRGKDEMRRPRARAGNSDVLDRTQARLPPGPHDQPQSMCPAFGSLRVGLRMRRTATVLSGSACCVYGLTFTSHFYGARRTVGYVPFNSETLVTGKLFEDIRDAVHELADPERTTRSSSPTFACRPLRACRCGCCPNQINGVRIIGIDVPGFGVPTHAEAKDVLAGAMLAYARNEGRARPRLAPRGGERKPADGDPARRDVSRRPGGIGSCWSRWAWLQAPVSRRGNGANSTPRSTARRRRDSSVLHRIVPRIRGRPARSSARPRSAATAPLTGSRPSVMPAASRRQDRRRQEPHPAGDRGALGQSDQGPHHAVRLRGLGAARGRLLVESGADVRYVGTACPEDDNLVGRRPRLARGPGVEVRYRASLEQDLAAVEEFEPDLAIGTTPVVQKAKELAIPALYFTNLISARPLMGRPGAGLAGPGRQCAMQGQARFVA